MTDKARGNWDELRTSANNKQFLDQVEQNIMIYTWRTDQLFASSSIDL